MLGLFIPCNRWISCVRCWVAESYKLIRWFWFWNILRKEATKQAISNKIALFLHWLPVQGYSLFQDCTTVIQTNNFTSTHLPIWPSSIPIVITSSSLQWPLSASWCWDQNCFQKLHFLLCCSAIWNILPTDLTENFNSMLLFDFKLVNLVFAAWKRISTNLHSRLSHKRNPHLWFVSLNWHIMPNVALKGTLPH